MSERHPHDTSSETTPGPIDDTASDGDLQGIYSEIQRYSIHDGPGIRTSVFLKGCPLTCTWCHNPENQSAKPELYLLEDRCIRCGACVEACPLPDRKSAEMTEVQRSTCLVCARCVEACPASARRLMGQVTTVRDLVAILERQRPFYEQSGGGVTFSGGEPLLQGDFLLACLKTLKQRTIHTAVDTCGYADTGLVLETARYTDLFLYDLKIMDDAQHRKYTGVSVEPILENLTALDKAGAEIWIRVPVIPGVNDDKENILALGRFAATLHKTRKVFFLPFHQLGSDKYRRFNKPYSLRNLDPPSSQALKKVVSYLADSDLEIYIRG